MIVGYARVSALFQTAALQLEALRQAGCERVFIEQDTVAQRSRPELKAAFAHLRSGDTLVVWKLSRLARSVRQLAEITEELTRRNVSLRVLDEAIDSSNPEGQVIINAFALLAKFERDLALERTHAGRAHAKTSNRRGGRRPALGIVDIKRAKAMLSDPTLTVAEIAQRLGIRLSTFYRHVPGGRSSLGRNT